MEFQEKFTEVRDQVSSRLILSKTSIQSDSLFDFFFLHSRRSARLHFTDLDAVSIFDIQFMFGLQTRSGEIKMN